MHRIWAFRPTNTLFLGLGASAAYGLLGAFILLNSSLGGMSEVQVFLEAYTTSVKTLFSFGLILGTALIVFRSQNVIPQTIEATKTRTMVVALAR